MMLLLVLTIFLLLLSIFEYKSNNNEIASPPVLFLVPFVIACIVAILWSSEWNLHLHYYTFFVIIIGCLSFCIGDFIARKIKVNCIKTKNNNLYRVENWKLILFALFSLVCYLWKIKCIKSFGLSHGYNTLFSSIGYLNHLAKFTTEEYIKYPGILSICLQLITAAGFVWSCLLAITLVNKQKKKGNQILILINFIISIIGSMTSGGRGGAMQLIIAFMSIYLLMYIKNNKNIKKIPFKVILKVIILIAITLYGFIFVMDYLGRQEIHMIGKYLANYIGAQIYNLDAYLSYNYKTSVIFGQETFQPIILTISKILGIAEWSNYKLDLPFIYANSKTLGIINLGNVYTTFYAYIHDFGFLGIIFFPFTIGFISRIAYKIIKYDENTTKVTIPIIVYSNIAYALVFSYFSNKFFELIITPNMIKKIIFTYIILIYLYKIKVSRYQKGGTV